MLTLLAAAALAIAPPPATARVASPCPSSTGQATALPATFPIEVWNNHIYVKGCVAERELDFILDTGAGGPATSDFGRAASLSIGAIELAHPIVQLFGDSAGVFSQRGAWVGNIGGTILRRFTVLLDYQGKRMILEPNARIGEAFETDMSGVGLVMDDSLSSVIVDAVAPASPAAEGGLLRGDVIVSVDGAPATRRLVGELRERFRRPDEHVVFVVRRGGETRRVEFVTRRLV